MNHKISFVNFWSNFVATQNWFTCLLDKYNIHYTVVDKDPDIIIYSVFGEFNKNLITTKPVRTVFYTGEIWRGVDPRADLNLTFDYTIEHNNIRLPLWVIWGDDRDCRTALFIDKDLQLRKENKEKFCCFVYSQDVEHRNKFCTDLSQYKKVDAGGRCLNNIGGRVANKIEFQKQYKFCIAYENTVHPGYTDEKILEPYQSNCIPIYYGNETITSDFNKETFINAHDFNSNEELIEYIKRVDEDEELYNSYLNKPVYSDYWFDIFNDPEDKFFKNICNKILGI